MVKPKGLQEYLQDDASLGEKVTYEQFEQKMLTSGNSDYEVERAYRSYRKALEELNEM